MAYNTYYDDTTDIYFTGQEYDEYCEYPEYNETCSNSTEPGYKVYYESGCFEDEYVLPPANQKTTHSGSDKTPKATKKRDVQSFYDGDGYTLPDIDGCITKGIVQRNNPGEKQPEISSDGEERKCSVNKRKLFGILVLLLAVGVIGGIVVIVFKGIITLCFNTE